MDPDLRRHIDERSGLLDQVREILIARLHLRREPDEIDPDAPLFGTGLGLDSVDAVELMVALEAQFGVLLPDDIAGRRALRTVDSLIDTVLEQQRRARERQAHGA